MIVRVLKQIVWYTLYALAVGLTGVLAIAFMATSGPTP